MTDPLEVIAAAHDAAAWHAVPVMVARGVTGWSAAALDVAAAHRGPGAAYWTPPGEDAAVLVKRAEGDFLRPAADALAMAQRPLGGPHPLALALVGGVLGSGLGYGGGALGERLAGGRLERGKLRRTGALAGAALGALPGLAWGGVNAAHPAATGGGAGAWTSPWPFAPGLDEAPPPAAPVPGYAAPPSRFDGRVLADPGFADPGIKRAAMAGAGAFYMPTIPVDAFNAAVWSDVRPANPFGTRSPWGDNEAPLGTPPSAAAAVSGLVAGAAAATGTAAVSPYHVALVAGAAGGAGYVAGALAGKVLGALAGLPPAAQESLRRGGLWGGIIAGVADAVFGGG